MTRPLFTACHLLIAVAAVWFPEPGQGLVHRHDVTDREILEMGRGFPAVGRVGSLGDGTLIAPTWVLTAGHVARGAQSTGTSTFRLETSNGIIEARIAETFEYPHFRGPGAGDLGLLRLGSPISGVAPLQLLGEATVSVGTECVLVGHGKVGRGDQSLRTEDGRRRAGTNRVHELGEEALVFRFESPESGATPLEVTPGPGDSGGPALVRVNSGYRIAAVSSAGFPGEAGPGTYGARDVFARVHPAMEWIAAVTETGKQPNKSTSKIAEGGSVIQESVEGQASKRAKEQAATHPAGPALLALIEHLQDPEASLEDFVTDRFARSDSPQARTRRVAALENLRTAFLDLHLSDILRTTPEQIDALLRGSGREAILGVRIDDQGRIIAIFEGRP